MIDSNKVLCKEKNNKCINQWTFLLKTWNIFFNPLVGKDKKGAKSSKQ